jgi:hypothetical protein
MAEAAPRGYSQLVFVTAHQVLCPEYDSCDLTRGGIGVKRPNRKQGRLVYDSSTTAEVEVVMQMIFGSSWRMVTSHNRSLFSIIRLVDELQCIALSKKSLTFDI